MTGTRRLRPARAGALLAALTATALAPVPAGAQQPSAPALDGAPFPLATVLSPRLTTFDAAGAETALTARVADGLQPRLVVARVSAADGTRVGSDLVLSDAASAPAGTDAAVATAVLPAATPAERPTWIVAWVARDPVGATQRVVGRRVTADGVPAGAPVTLSDGPYAEIGDVALSVATPGRRVLVAWRGAQAADADRSQVVVQGWEPGAGLTPPTALRVSSPSGEAHGSLAVASDARGASGRHLVAWRGSDPQVLGNAAEQEVLGRVLDATGMPIGDVRRLSHVGADGDAFARPLALALNGERQQPAAATWALAWTQWPAGDAAVRQLDADAQGAPPRTVAPALGAAIGDVAVAGLGRGVALAHDAGTGVGTRRVELVHLPDDETAPAARLQLSAPGEDARLPLLSATRQSCRSLALWRGPGGATATARLVTEPDCAAPPQLPAPAPVAPPVRSSPSGVRRTFGPARIRGLRLRPRRIRAGRSARLRFRVTAPATVVVSIERAPRARRTRTGAPLPRLRPAAATLRRVIAREPQTVVVRIAARDGRGRALAPGPYRVVVRATPPRGARPPVVRVPLRIAGR